MTNQRKGKESILVLNADLKEVIGETNSRKKYFYKMSFVGKERTVYIRKQLGKSAIRREQVGVYLL